MDPILIALLSGIVALGIAWFMASYVLKQDQGNQKIREISAAIKEGALAFIGREYRILGIFVIAVTVILGVIPDLGWLVALAFIFGAICSGLAGFIGMSIAIRANSRTAAAAQKSLNHSLKVSFRGGAVMGMSVVGIGIIGPHIFRPLVRSHGLGREANAIAAAYRQGQHNHPHETSGGLTGRPRGLP